MQSDPFSTGSLEGEIDAVEGYCRQAIQTSYRNCMRSVTGLPHESALWFELLAGFPDPGAVNAVSGWATDAAASGICSAGAVARYGILQAGLVALPRLTTLAVHGSLLRLYCGTLQRIARHMDGSEKRFEPNSDSFEELARIVTLRRYHAGQSSFDIMSMPRTWFLRVHPLALPGVIREVAMGLGGLGPIVMPHLNYWRENPMLLLPQENDRAMWRIARTLERRPDIRGLVATSWLYSIHVGEISSHLAWVRNFYLENGAYLVDMEPTPERLGFLVGSKQRQRLYAEGKFKPRNVLVLWRRADILSWADSYSESDSEARPRAARAISSVPRWRHDANKIISSGQLTLIRCEKLMTFRPRIYWLRVFLLPLVLLSIIVATTQGLWAVMPSAAVAVVILWLFQYFFLQ